MAIPAVLLLAGFAYATLQIVSKTSSKGVVPGSVLAPISPTEKAGLLDKLPPVSVVDVTHLLADTAEIHELVVDNLTVNGVITGNGAGLTNIPASSIQGPISDSQLSNNVAFRNQPNTFTATNKFTGNVSINNLSLSNPLTVSSGGTGASSLANNGVLIGQGTNPVTGVTSSAAGQCLISTAGAPSFQTCPGSSAGVTSLDGLTGALTIANSSGAGTTITIDNASTTTYSYVVDAQRSRGLASRP